MPRTHSPLFIEMEPSSFSIVHPTFIKVTSLKMHLVSRTASFAKLFLLLSFFGLIMYSVLAVYTFQVAFTTVTKAERTQQNLKRYPVPEVTYNKDIKYILLWTIPEIKHDPIEDGQSTFIDNDCEHLNCFLTTNKTLLNDVKKFDAIVFSITTLKQWKKYSPKTRSAKQKYVFYSMIPASTFPVCNVKADDFFNWTWTYKLYSEISTPFIEVKDLKGNLVAPNMNIEWPDDLVRKFNVSKTRNRSKAMMWQIEKCDNVHAIQFAKDLQINLKEHALVFDIYGCGNKRCPKEGCLGTIEKYSFYLAIEDAFTDDYVTTEVLKGVHHNTVPVVVGGADYSKFLPPGSYIDAHYESPETLASLLEYIIRNPTSYNKYFTWKNYYTINEASIQKGYCQLCALLNDQRQMETHSSYESFRKWWFYGNLKEKCYPKGAENMDDVLSFIDDPKLRMRYNLQSL